jgi:hypothetical protein
MGRLMRTALVVYLGALAILIGTAGGGAYALFNATGPDDVVEEAADQHGYDFFLWEVENFPRKWVYKLHHLPGGEGRDDERTLERYFDLGSEIAALREQGTEGQLRTAQQERTGLEAEVEEILEGRITTILEGEDLQLEPPLFSDLGLIFPPVDFELDAPPRVLAVSPRERIEWDRSFLLEPGLEREEFGAIEAKAESKNRDDGAGVSAVVVGTGGVATYPSVLSAEDDYEGMVTTAFHEWLHQYLIFFPLGRSYFEGAETRTLNESVASLGGRALSELYFARYGGLPPAQSHPAPVPGAFDFTAEMRALRREVETMLSDGRVTEAEALMERRRQEFAQQGVTLRKLNQAYFAFHGFYADSPGSIDPIGPKLQELLDLVTTPGAFLREARGVTSRAELDAALAEARN